MRLLLRICRRMGPLGETKGAPLMKNSVPFYRSRSVILHTAYRAYTGFVCVQAGGATYEGEVQVHVNVSAARGELARLLPRPGWATDADDDHELIAAGFPTQFFLDSGSILALDRRT